MNREYKEKEDLMMRIIFENGGVDMQALFNQYNESNNKGDVFRQYLKNKENELAEAASQGTS